MSEANTQRSAKSFTAKLPGINRIKAVKDLLLAKLDTLLSSLSNVDIKLNALLENDSPLLQGVIALVKVTQKVQAQTNQLQAQTNQIQAQTNQIQAQTNQIQEQTNHILELLKSIQPKVVVESDADPETRLMAYLYSYLPSRCAIDIGANIGEVSNKLLEAGYEVYAFEPFPDTFNRLKQRFSGNSLFHGYPIAIGAVDETRELYVAQDQSSTHIYKDSTLYNSLTKHTMPDDLVFVDSVPVQVRSLASLHDASELPTDIGLVKIDTEGFDLEVLRGMGNYHYPVVMTEFWDPHIPFGRSAAYNRLEDLVDEMKRKGYHWYLTIYRVWGSEGISFYCNHPRTVEHSWGNVLFFKNYETFSHALKWCSTILATTYFN
ncbi:MAG: FkbM family methyltransferase [Coleofasciculus sp. S288]|nr:FkbM family methyltransferase [Coleofasciculus sp. S288]